MIINASKKGSELPFPEDSSAFRTAPDTFFPLFTVPRSLGFLLCGLFAWLTTPATAIAQPPQPAVVSPAELPPAPLITLDAETTQRCLQRLRAGLRGTDFWPAMHAAEALTLAGKQAEVIEFLEPLLDRVEDDQQRCGVARELVRAGKRDYAAVLLKILSGEDPHGHVHACESLFKVYEVGDGEALRAAFDPQALTSKTVMASAALARWGNRDAHDWLRARLRGDDFELARVSAWVAGQLGDPSDLPAINAWRTKLDSVEQRHYFDNAAALLGDAEAAEVLIESLRHADPAVRTYAADFSGAARLAAAKPNLIALLDDPHPDAAIRAAQSLLQMAAPQPPADAQNEFAVDVYPATDANPRYSEGSVIALTNGSLLYATTEFSMGGSDASQASIVGRVSPDGGRTWGPSRRLQENVGEQNVMSVTLRRMGRVTDTVRPLAMFYMVKNSPRDLQLFLKLSDDEGEQFGDPIRVTTTPGYHVVNNDRITRLSTGRWLAPVASTDDVAVTNHFVCRCFLSDDEGQTWRPGTGEVDYPQRGAMEPEVLELTDGRVLMLFRNQLGHIGSSLSEDGGDTWSEPESFGVRAPEAPATLRRIPSTGDLMLIWNDNYQPGAGHGGKRTPLTVAISSDEGQTWRYRRDLETDPNLGFSYISLTFDQGRALLSYYIHDADSARISSRFRSLPISHLYSSGEPNDQAARPSVGQDFEPAGIPAAPVQALILAPGENNPRNSEGAFVTLADGRLMFVYTHFTDGAGDHASASLKARFSDDGGQTWSDDDAEVIENTAGLNVMSVSLLRLRNGKIALFYLLKDSLTDCRPQLRLSSDEGKTWSPPINCITDEVGYYVLNNDRAIQLSSGRLVLPVCLHNGPEFAAPDWQGEVMTYLSDDDGQTWRRGKTRLRAHAADGRRWTVQEPGVVELSGGRAMMFVRSDAGSQLLAFSEDGCDTWTDLRQSDIISPLSPASIKRIPSTGDLLLVWNNHANAPAEIRGKRTPLTAAISKDDGKSWENIQNIWDDPHRHYCYIAIHFIDDQVVLGHCAGDRRENNGLAESHITRFPITWLYTPDAEER
ncbi:MAG: hypothetical protein EA381_12700 [Planctomycetaceae bacterium]|nr:MAG: hypothetical protein EA381_12700 [Planctomycetaceae bacterium]